MITLRPYQPEAVAAIFSFFERSPAGHPLAVLPTGAGKSYVIAAFCKQAIEAFPSTRILVATHRAELIEQDTRAIATYWPEADVGMYSAGLGQRRVRPITVAGVQSIVNVEGMPAFDLLLIDEAHLVPKDGDGHYRTLIAKLEKLNPALRRVGFTATPYRLNGGKLTRGAGKMFTSICYDLPVQRLVDEGALSPLVTPQNDIGQGFDTHKVKTASATGDFNGKDLASSVEGQHEVTRAALEETARIATSRKSWIVFCVSIEHARQAAECLFAMGIAAHVVTGEDDMGSRRAKIEEYKRGDVRVLVNCDVLTVGFDAPRTDCIVLLRPTQSTGLYVQICGRGMRLFDGKTDCLVMDYGGNIERHGPITHVKPKEAKESAPVNMKFCPKCDAELKSYVRECGECGYVFPLVPREIDHERAASNRAIMGPPPEPEWIPLQAGFSLSRHEKRPTEEQPNPTPTVKCTYHVGNLGRRDFAEWACPEHSGFAAEKFARWWRERGGNKPIPSTVDETIERADELKPIDAIVVEPDGKFTRVTKVRFAAAREPGSDDDKGEEMSEREESQLGYEEDALPF